MVEYRIQKRIQRVTPLPCLAEWSTDHTRQKEFFLKKGYDFDAYRCKIHIGEIEKVISMAEHKAPSGLGGLGKSFLVPHILLLLRDMPIHGYELMQKLTSLGFQALDQGNFYRTMRQLEKESYVHSEWDTSSSGPAKRLYSLTEMGEKYLQAYADELQRYQNMLNQFFDMYSKMFDLYLFPFRKEGDEEEKNNQP